MRINGFQPHLLSQMAEFVHGRTRLPVGGDHAVAAEIEIVNCFSEISSVSEHFASLFIARQEPLIDPIPNETALKRFFGTEQIPVIGKGAAAVAHGVVVLAQDSRAGRRGIFRKLFQLFQCCIHGIIQRVLGEASAALPVAAALPPALLQLSLVEHDARRVQIPDHLACRLMILAVTGFVAGRPGENTGMGTVAKHHPFGTAHNRIFPARIAADRHIVGMGFKIRLVHNIDAVFVAEVIPAGIVRVVTGPHRVEIELLQKADVGKHVFTGKRFPGNRMVLMAVDAADHHAFSVEKQGVIFDADIAEPHLPFAPVQDIPRRIAQLCRQSVKRRLLRRPRPDAGKIFPPVQAVAGKAKALIHNILPVCNFFAVAIQQACPDRIILRRSAERRPDRERKAEMSGEVKLPVPIPEIEIAVDRQILKPHRTGGIKPDAPVNPRHPPLVLIFDVAGV